MHPFDQYCLRGIDARAPFGIVRPARRTDGRIDGRAVDRLVRALGNHPFAPFYLLLGEIPILRYAGLIVRYTRVSVQLAARLQVDIRY